MFTTIIVKPLFNLLVLIYALIPGHNFGLSIIIFTVIIRLLLWPLLKKQLIQAKAMRKLQPDIKRIKQKAKGDKQKESMLLMELYKEKGINPFATIPILIVQLVVLIGLYSGLRKVISNPRSLVTFAYPSVQHIHWIEKLHKNIHLLDYTLFHVVDLSKPGLTHHGVVYYPALIIVILSAVIQYFQSKQLMPSDKNQRKLREILKEAGNGKQADPSELNAAVSGGMRYFIPFFIFIVTVYLPSALSLYWLTGGLVAFIQQSIALKEDETEMEEIADAPVNKKPSSSKSTKSKKDVRSIPEAKIVNDTKNTKTKKAKNKSSGSNKSKKRRK